MATLDQKYMDYITSSEWAAKRSAILKRDGYLCQRCRDKKAKVVHHKTYKRFGNEKRSDLVSLCKDCHEELHDI